MRPLLGLLFLLAGLAPAQGALSPGGPLAPIYTCGRPTPILNPAILSWQPPGEVLAWSRSLRSNAGPTGTIPGMMNMIPCAEGMLYQAFVNVGFQTTEMLLPALHTNSVNQLLSVMPDITLLGYETSVEWLAHIPVPPVLSGMVIHLQWWHFWDEPGYGTRMTGTQRLTITL